jgi:tetratricopeptide (TPR) repeat protein
VLTCPVCGEPLGFWDRLLRRNAHNRCRQGDPSERSEAFNQGRAVRREGRVVAPTDAPVLPDAGDATERALEQAPKVRGRIGHFGLAAWWLTEFTEEERRTIQSRYGRWVSASDPTHEATAFDGRYMLVEAEGSQSGGTAAFFLANLAEWLNTPSTRDLARRVLEKAEAVCSDALDRHIVYQVLIPVSYKDRHKDRMYLEAAISACHKQIAVAQEAIQEWGQRRGGIVPTHKGYEQLAIIREKEGNYKEAIRLSRKAMEQGWGWKAQWDRRIERCERKLAKVAGLSARK